MLVRTIVLIAALIFAAPNVAETVYLARHAEKQTGPDPGLTQTGRQRAADLALLLREAGIRHVFSSDFQRTRDTAAPLAAALELDIQLYDPHRLSALVERLKRLDGNSLVVGHSNTTPELVRLLGGAAEPMPEWEYDRVYQLRLDTGPPETVLLRLAPESVEPDN